MGRKPPEYRTAGLGGGDSGGGSDVGSLLPPPLSLSLLLTSFTLFSLSSLSAFYRRAVSVERSMFFENHDHIGGTELVTSEFVP